LQDIKGPDNLACLCVKAGEVASAAQGVNAIAIDRRRTAWSIAAIITKGATMRGRPCFFSGSHVESHHKLAFAAQAERVDAPIAHGQ
jgi:hypothetical protein